MKVIVALFALVAVASASVVAPAAYSVAAPYAVGYSTPYAHLGYAAHLGHAAPFAYAAAPVAAVQSGYVAATRGSVHTAPLPEGPFAFSHHINTAPAPGTW